MNKAGEFQKELAFIKDNDIWEFVHSYMDNKCPDYFYEIAASTTGKYHPSYALGEGGLVRHTKAATRIAVGMFVLFPQFNQLERDEIVAALIMHDTFKCGAEHNRYTKADHPLIAQQMILDYYHENEDKFKVPYDTVEDICSLIATHMGQWNKDYRTKREILPLPVTKAQKYVHMCDYLASRKYLEFNFDTELL